MAGTYADALKKITDAGLYDQTSEFDKGLLVTNPGFADNIVRNKTGYMNATTPEERQSYNDKMNADRAYYGGYTGGTAGMDYFPTGNNTYKNMNLTNIYSGALPNSGTGADGYKAPTPSQNSTNPYGDFTSEWTGNVKQMMLNPYEAKMFRYNYKSDPTYKGMLDAYTRNGEIAGKNTLARLAAATGGAPSTYAVQAATAAQAQEMDKLANYIPQLQQNAWNQYTNDRDFGADQYWRTLNTMRDLGDTDWDRYFRGNDTAYSRGRDEKNDAIEAEERARKLDLENRQRQDQYWKAYVQAGGDPSGYYKWLADQVGYYTGETPMGITEYQQMLAQQQMQAAGGSGGSDGQRRRRNPTPANPTPTPTQSNATGKLPKATNITNLLQTIRATSSNDSEFADRVADLVKDGKVSKADINTWGLVTNNGKSKIIKPTLNLY